MQALWGFSLILFAFGRLGFSLHVSHGHYWVPALFWTTEALGAWILGCAAWVWAERVAHKRAQNGGEPKIHWGQTPAAWLSFFLLLVGTYECQQLAENPVVIYAQVEGLAILQRLQAISWWAAFLAGVAHFSRARGAFKHLAWIFMAAAIGAAGLALVWVLHISPSPNIDVFTIGAEASQRLLKGINPYSSNYTDIYAGKFDYAPRLPYPPGYFLSIVPAYAIFGDTRVTQLVATALSLFFIFRLFGKKNAWLASLLSWVWLVFPVNAFVTEQAWIDPIYFPLVLGAADSIQKERWRRAGLFLGSAILIKQYVAVSAAFAVLAVLRRKGKVASYQMAQGIAVMLVVVLVPFAIWDYSGLWFTVVTNLDHMAPRLDAHTWTAYFLNHTGSVPALLFPIGMAVAGSSALALIWRKSSDGFFGTQAWLAASAVFFLSGFLVAKMAFCNYYTWVAFLMIATLASAIGRIGEGDETLTG